MAEAGASLRIQEMTARHLPRILAIEALVFHRPWSEASFRHELLAGNQSHNLVASTTTGQAGDGEVVAGYICFWVLFEELHINNIAVDPSWQRRGVGSKLLGAALEEGSRASATVAYLEVRPSNAAARSLYGRLGFREIGRRPGYYGPDGEDALILGRRLPGCESFL